jgi:hypothetical protein
VLDLTAGTTYYVRVRSYDTFGAGAYSLVDDGEPTKIPAVNVDAELQNSFTITTDGLTVSGTDYLYDDDRSEETCDVTTTSGVSNYIQYAYGINDYFYRFGVWTDGSASVYFSLSNDGSSWSYYKAEADHTTDADAKLILASNEADAQTNYWSISAGENIALLPSKQFGKYAKIHFVGTTSVGIYEFVPVRIKIAEIGAFGSVSATYATLGTVQAGVIQTPDYGADDGTEWDLDTGDITIGGYSNPKLKYDASENTIEMRSENGTITLSGDTITIKDGSDNTRVIIGDIS